MEVYVKVEGLDKAYESAKHFPKAADKAMDETMQEAAGKGYTWMYAITPVKMGALRSSLFSRQTSASSMEIGATAPHAVFVHQGTRPHEIRAVRARALRFEWRGQIVFFKRVWHPGTKPNPFVRMTVVRLVEFIRTTFLQKMRIFMELGRR